VILLVGIWLRLANQSQIAVEHFDEGVYASNLFFSVKSGGAYPMQAMYAPPLFPALVETTTLNGGQNWWGIFGVNIFCSVATNCFTWMIGRNWISKPAGLLAAGWVATNDMQIGLATSALTEPLMGLLLCATLFYASCASRSARWFGFTWNPPSPLSSVHRPDGSSLPETFDTYWLLLAGFMCGLCWSTKYNGWLPLAMILTTWVIMLVINRKGLDLRSLLWSVVVVCSLPLAIHGCELYYLVERRMYDIVFNNHSQYFVGLTGWWLSFVEHVNQLNDQGGWLTTALSVVLLLSLSLPYVRTKIGWPSLTRFQMRNVISASLLWIVGGLIGQSAWVLLLYSAVGIFRLVLPVWFQPARFTCNAIFSRTLLLVWWGSLLVAIPLYTPYPRLAYPWMLAVCLGVGSFLADLIRTKRSASAVDASIPQPVGSHFSGDLSESIHLMALIVGFAMLPVLGFTWPSPIGWQQRPMVDAWQDRTGLAKIASEVQQLIEDPPHRTPADVKSVPPKVFAIYAEPGAFFQMSARGQECFPIQSYEFIQGIPENSKVQVYTLWGDRAAKSNEFMESWNKVVKDFELVKQFPYQPSPFVWRDEVGIRTQPPMQQVNLYRLKKTP
jgi:hypothetical protein